MIDQKYDDAYWNLLSALATMYAAMTPTDYQIAMFHLALAWLSEAKATFYMTRGDIS